VEVKSKTVEVI